MLAKKNLHPTVKEFKDFVKKHPNLVKHVKENNESWQPYYEKWVLLGEDDETWDQFKDTPKGETKKTKQNKETTANKDSTSGKQKEFLQNIMGMVENVDLDKVEGHINQLNGAITNIQSLVSQFQTLKNQRNQSSNNSRPPIQFGRD